MATLRQNIDWLLREKYGAAALEELAGSARVRAAEDIGRLKRGEHIDYVIGFARFLDLKIDLAARPLIPRPETEFWTEKVIEDINRAGASPRKRRRTLDILDVFCGSGCIGLAVLKHCPHARVDFADVEPAYFLGIRRSARWNKIGPRRMRCIASDVLAGVGAKKYDYIFANPPYIPRKGRKVQKSVLAQEPHRALFGGTDGLRFIRTLLRGAKKHLAVGGRLIVEFDPPQKTKIGAMARRLGYEVQFFRDQYGRWRYCSLKVRLLARSISLA